MKSRIVCGLFVIALVSMSSIVKGVETPTSENAPRFEALKKLVGDWVEVDKDGKPTDKLVSSIRLTAKGTVIQETLFPNTDHEMVTMYHLDGANLVLTHYCTLGNQPTMRAEPGQDANRYVFQFVSAGNLKSEDENHMHQATLTLVDQDHFKAEWVASKDGKPCHKVGFSLARKAK